jgi:hypothetical protein
MLSTSQFGDDITIWCRCIDGHIFYLVQSTRLRPVASERGVIQDAGVKISPSYDKNVSFGVHINVCVSIARLAPN